MQIRLIAISALVLVAGCGPILLIPGGELDGLTAPVPSDWSIADDVNTVQLETRPEDPYSVNIWAIGIGPRLYVHAGANRSSWVEHIETNSDVRIRIGDKLYDLRASRVEDRSFGDRDLARHEGALVLRRAFPQIDDLDSRRRCPLANSPKQEESRRVAGQVRIVGRVPPMPDPRGSHSQVDGRNPVAGIQDGEHAREARVSDVGDSLYDINTPIQG